MNDCCRLPARREVMLVSALTLCVVPFVEAVPAGVATPVQDGSDSEHARAQWEVFTERADLALRRGDLPTAERNYCSALRQAQTDRQSWERLFDSLRDLGDVLRKQGRLAEATKLAERSLDEASRRFSPSSQRLDPILASLVALYREQDRLDEAARRQRELLELRQRVLQPSDPLMLVTLMDLQALYERGQRFAKAEEIARRVLVLRQDQGELSGIASAWNSLGGILAKCSKWSEAEECFGEELNLLAKCGKKGSREYYLSLIRVGEFLARQGRLMEAEAIFRRGLSEIDSVNPADPAELNRFLSALAKHLELCGRYREAEQCWRRRLQTLRSAKSFDPDLVARVERRFGEFRLRAKQARSR